MIYRCPACNAEFRADAAGVVLCPACNGKVRVEGPAAAGNAWDRATRGGWVNAMFETVKLSIVDPVAFFGQVAEGGGWLRPWVFAVVITAAVFAIAVAYQLGFQALAASFQMGEAIKSSIFPVMAFSVPLTIIATAAFSVIAVPIIATVGLFFQTVLYHLCLLILGAARRDFQTTFRIVCYSQGPQVFQIVPLLGGIVGPMWQMVLGIIGIKVVHQTTYSRAAIAVLLPMMLCCGVIILVIAAIAGGVAAAVFQSAAHGA